MGIVVFGAVFVDIKGYPYAQYIAGGRNVGYVVQTHGGVSRNVAEDIANVVSFLCSDKAGFITGENICIDGGMTKLMIYHDDHGWTYAPEED